MLPVHRDDCFTFRFEDDRIIPRIHLEAVERGWLVSILRMDPVTNQRLHLLAAAAVGEGGWVDLPQPITVHAGEAFVALPYLVRPEGDQDHGQVREVNRAAFEQEGEANLVDALRAGGSAPVSLVAEVNGRVVGHILFSDLKIETSEGPLPALALAPMAVLPAFQRHGIGSTLVRAGLEACKHLGHRIVVVLGHPGFYPRFGFSATLAERLQSPYGGGPEHMAAELVPGALHYVAGRLVYAAPFNEL